MKLLTKALLTAGLLVAGSYSVFSQTYTPPANQPTDYLTPAFHAGRRQALRDLMPPNSVAVIFAYPERVFSNDNNYVFHQNPDLYYFSGYKEPDAVLFIFKDMQADGDSSYNELFFVRHRNPFQEQWTGRRLGVAGVKSQLGFKRVYNGDAFNKFPLDLKKFSVILTDDMPVSPDDGPGSLGNLVSNFVERSGVKQVNKTLESILQLIDQRATPQNLPRIMNYVKPNLDDPDFKNDAIIQELVNKPDSATLVDVKVKINANQSGHARYIDATTKLRGIKTPEEIVLLKKSIQISAWAHAGAMRAVNPQMSERELEGIMLYIHKKNGAEDEGYPPIIGAGANGCILHYEENNATKLDNQLVLMDVGAEYHGYSADVTRTFPANGKFTDEQKAIYQIIYDTQEEVFKLCKEGVKYGDLEKKTREVMAARLKQLGIIKTDAELATYYPHGVSHHLGLDVHDRGEYGGNLQSGMVITVEPGIYIPAGSPCDKKWWNIGVRIEDDVLVGKDGGTVLSADAPRRWDEVGKMEAEKSMFKGK